MIPKNTEYFYIRIKSVSGFALPPNKSLYGFLLLAWEPFREHCQVQGYSSVSHSSSVMVYPFAAVLR